MGQYPRVNSGVTFVSEQTWAFVSDQTWEKAQNKNRPELHQHSSKNYFLRSECP